MSPTFAFRVVASLVVCFSLTQLAEAQTATVPSDSSMAAVIVTILTKKSSAPSAVVQKEDIILREGGVRKKILAWIPARDDHSSLQLAIVVDDASRKDLGNQIQALKKFILAQPPNTTVAIYYALGGSLQQAMQFTSDHGSAANALRPPRGAFGNFVSPFSAVSQLIDSWPVTMARREILLLTPGFDLIHHELHSSDLEGLIQQAQLSGILLHPILLTPPPSLSPYSEIGRSNLTQLADETGGQSLVGALSPPLTIREETGGSSVRDSIPMLDVGPVLKSLGTALENQYFLVWKTAPSKTKGGELRPYTLQAEDRNLRIIAPPKAFVP